MYCNVGLLSREASPFACLAVCPCGVWLICPSDRPSWEQARCSPERQADEPEHPNDGHDRDDGEELACDLEHWPSPSQTFQGRETASNGNAYGRA